MSRNWVKIDSEELQIGIGWKDEMFLTFLDAWFM
jgi:hypothetical protein